MGITNPNEVVTSYAKYIPVHGLPVHGVLTIAPTRIIFEPNLDDPEVFKDGLLAHQFSVETGRLLEVETFTDAVLFRERLDKQLEEQAPWDRATHPMRADLNAFFDPKLEKAKAKKAKAFLKTPIVSPPVVHFDPTAEEMLQIVCRGRYRPKNYANFVLPKDKAAGIYHKLVFFLSGSKEERLKACLNLDVCAPPRRKPKFRRQHSFSTVRLIDKGYANIIENLQAKRKLSRAGDLPPPQLESQQTLESPRLKKDKAKKDEAKKDEVKKEKKPEEKRRGTLTEKWRARKASNADKSPRSTPPTSPTLVAVSESEQDAKVPLINLATTSLSDTDFILVTPPPQSPAPQSPAPQPSPLEEAADLPIMRDESLIFTEKHMHQLRRYLPGYTKWLDWKLLYCTQTHGISYSTFMHRAKEHSPTLFVVEDSNGFVFGGFATAPWAVNTGYFGTGQSFLFSLKPKFHVYEWTRANSFFMLMTSDAVAMGGDKDGRHGFWVDSNFELGSSEICATYFNRCLASTERFKCTVVELWTFTESKSK